MVAEKQTLTDPLLIPTIELLGEVMHNNYVNFDRLLSLLNGKGITIQWNYYKDGKAWLAKAQRKNKTVLWISIWERCFKLSFFFTEKTRIGLDQLTIAADIKKKFREQQAIGRLIPLIVEIRNDSLFNDIEQIIEYRICCNK